MTEMAVVYGVCTFRLGTDYQNIIYFLHYFNCGFDDGNIIC